MVDVSTRMIITLLTDLIPAFFVRLCTFDLFLVFVCACIVYWCASAVQSLMGV